MSFFFLRLGRKSRVVNDICRWSRLEIYNSRVVERSGVKLSGIVKDYTGRVAAKDRSSAPARMRDMVF